MMRFVRVLALLVGLAAGFGFLTQTARAEDNSTPEERARIVAITHKSETDLLNKDLHDERVWAFKRIAQVDDIHVSLCPSILGSNFLSSKYKYSSEVTLQLLLASASFIIENPDKAGDVDAANQAAAQSVLKAYESALKDKPKDKSKDLDLLLQKRDSGQLAQAIQENGKSCNHPH